jgi:hypothetical protein
MRAICYIVKKEKDFQSSVNYVKGRKSSSIENKIPSFFYPFRINDWVLKFKIFQRIF